MHILRSETVSLDETVEAVDLDLSPADILFLSFTDSDLAGLVDAWEADKVNLPTLAAANLNALKHPFSVDLLAEKLLPSAKCVLVRLLGGKDYWPYGVEELSRAARQYGFSLAILPGDYQADPRLDEASTLAPETLTTLWRFFHEGGRANLVRCLDHIATLIGYDRPLAAPEPVAALSLYEKACRAGPEGAPHALLVAYRSVMIAEDTAPLVALADALALRGFCVTCACVSSLKDPAAVIAMKDLLALEKPDIILNTTAFSAKLDDGSTVLDLADVPVLQTMLATTKQDAWEASSRGLSATDIAMNVVLPELDGRLISRAISFKTEIGIHEGTGLTRVVHQPIPDRLSFVADLARNWVSLRRKKPSERRISLVLSDYPHKGGRSGYAVGLDTPQSVAAIAADLKSAGYAIDAIPDPSELMTALTKGAPTHRLPLSEYEILFETLPNSFRETVIAQWGTASDDPMLDHHSFSFRFITAGNLMVALQPARGRINDIKTGYHDAALAPSHAYIAFYLLITRYLQPDAMVHGGTHGTLEWLPGKALALSECCAPEILLGPLPLIYPFIVNNPGEAAQAKRRLAAVTIGHLTPPLMEAGSHGAAIELESLMDEYANAQTLDPRRAEKLGVLILDRARSTGLIADAGLDEQQDQPALLSALDAWLCDIKEMRIADGLHIFGRADPTDAIERMIGIVAETSASEAWGSEAWGSAAARHRLLASADAERDGLLAALDGRFVAAGPAGAPSRGRIDVLPTGRNLYTIDPRGLPTRTAWEIGLKTAEEIVARYAQDHGDWPKSVVIDVWGSATMRTGGDELAQALALLGVRPIWDNASSRVTGFEILPPAYFGRPRIDVTLRVSGLFRDVFPAQIALFDEAVQAVSRLDETPEENPLAARRLKTEAEPLRIFSTAPEQYGTGLGRLLAGGEWQQSAELGEAYLATSSFAYRADGDALAAEEAFRERVASADAFVHVQDMAEQDILDSDAFAEHEGGFAAAAKSLGASPALYHVDATRLGTPAKIRTLRQEVARVLRGRATNPRWIEGQMRHGYRGATEIAETVSNLFAYAALADAVESRHFDLMFDATLGNETVASFLTEANPEAARAIAHMFREAGQRGYWQSRRNSTQETLAALLNEAAE